MMLQKNKAVDFLQSPCSFELNNAIIITKYPLLIPGITISQIGVGLCLFFYGLIVLNGFANQYPYISNQLKDTCSRVLFDSCLEHMQV